MYAAEARGELPKGTAARWQKETGKKKLPERKTSEKTAAWDAGVAAGMEKVAATRLAISESAPTSGETIAIRDPAERRRYLADMAARNARGAMRRPLSVRSAVVTQSKGSA